MSNTTDRTFTFNFDNWKMRDKNRFMRAVNEATKTGDETPVFPLVAEICSAWPFEGNPRQPEAYDGLEIEQWQELSEALGEALKERFQRRK